MEKEFFMKPKLRTKEKSVLGLRRNTFLHLQREMLHIHYCSDTKGVHMGRSNEIR